MAEHSHRIEPSTKGRSRARGFTIVELLVTVALVGIAASVALPLQTVIQTRAKESELKDALRTIRKGLDDFKAAADAGMIDRQTGASGYPQTLEQLVNGVPRTRSAMTGFNPHPFIVLRRLPRDPFATDPTLSAAQTWAIRSYNSKPGEFKGGKDVFDIASKSDKIGIDGTPYAEW